MKKIWNIVLMATVALFACNCGGGDDSKDGPGPDPDPNNGEVAVKKANVVGQWKLTAWSEDGVKDNVNFPDETHTVYAEFYNNGTFKFYQQNINFQGVVLFEGNFTLNESTKTLAGIYSDGENWGSNYTITKLTAETMTLVVENGSERSVYTKEQIPALIIESARPLEEVRSVEIPRFF